MLDQIFMSDNVTPPIPIVEGDSGLYIKPVLMGGEFAGFMPRDEITAEEQAGLLKGIPFKTDVPARPIGILRRRGDVLSSASMVLVNTIRQVCGYTK
jgi:DNA-binding transcriptional LysR family regulator